MSRELSEEEQGWLDDLRALGHVPARVDVAERLAAELLEVRRRARTSRRRLRWIFVSLVPAAIALAVGFRSVLVLGEDRTAVPATRPVADRIPATAAVEPLRALHPGPARFFMAGEMLPFDVPLGPVAGGRGRLRIEGRIDVGLDAGVEVTLPSRGGAGLELRRGRIDVAVPPMVAPFVLRFSEASIELSTHGAEFGALASAGARWSVAVRTGAVRTGAGEAIDAGILAGGTRADRVVRRGLSESLPLEAHVEPHRRGSVVRGLTDFLADLRVGDAEVTPDARGAFEWTSSSPLRRITLVAVDAAGRRQEKQLDGISRPVPSALRKGAPPGSREGVPADSATPPGDGLTEEKPWIRIGPMEW